MNIFVAILRGKSQAESLGKCLAIPFLEQPWGCVESQPNVVAVEHKTPKAARVEAVIDEVGQCAFTAAGEPRKPEHTPLVARRQLALILAHRMSMPANVNCFNTLFTAHFHLH